MTQSMKNAIKHTKVASAAHRQIGSGGGLSYTVTSDWFREIGSQIRK